MLPIGNGKQPLNVALLGTRGIPANYGGFETFAEELSIRLVRRGHRVFVYGRSHYVDPGLRFYRGVHIRVLPSIRTKYLDTVSHAALSLLVATFQPHDVILLCNAANAWMAWLPRLAGQRVVLNVDGIERRRRKWGWLGRTYYRLSEFLATEIPDAVVTDARSIQQYYRYEYDCASRFIPYGASSERLETSRELERLDLGRKRYLLYVSRLEPENNADLVIRAYRRSGVALPLVVVGDAPYSRGYIAHLRRLAEGARVLFPGAIYGNGYRELLSHCLCYVHATEVGGTHPALIEAMGAGCVVLVNETAENREVVGDAGLLYPFNDEPVLARLMRRAAAAPEELAGLGGRARERVRRCYDWEQVVTRYERLFYELSAGARH